jgi:hypothetical protein
MTKLSNTILLIEPGTGRSVSSSLLGLFVLPVNNRFPKDTSTLAIQTRIDQAELSQTFFRRLVAYKINGLVPRQTLYWTIPCRMHQTSLNTFWFIIVANPTPCTRGVKGRREVQGDHDPIRERSREELKEPTKGSFYFDR